MIRVAFCIGEYPPEQYKLRADAALSFGSDEVEVGLVDIQRSPYVPGLAPADLALLAPSYIDAYKQAEREGYDAVVPLGTLELGVDGGRSAVDIPVVGPMDAMLRIASSIGDCIGMIVYHDKLIPMQKGIVKGYGMEKWIVGWESVGFHLPDLADNHDKIVERVLEGGRRLIEEKGADVIIANGISICPVHLSAQEIETGLGVPVIEGIGAPIRYAAMMSSLGLRYSVKRWPKQAEVQSR